MIANINIASFGLQFFLSLVWNFKHLIQTLILTDYNNEDEAEHDVSLTVRGPTLLGEEGNKLRKEDVKVVMNKLGMSLLSDIDEEEKEDVSRIFDEEEPSLDELKEAFDVFDENKDGFVDASELGRVLRNLGFVKECKKSDCMRMIKAYDGNEDGVIDFSEFVKFMETYYSN